MSKKRTTEDFVELSQKVHGDKYDYSLVNYKSKEDKVDIICPIHGVFSQKASLHLKGSQCPQCSYIQRGNNCKKTKQEFILESNKIHNSFYLYDKFEYINSHTKGVITCPIHGDFEQKPNDHLSGKGCPQCNMSHLEREIFSFLKKSDIPFECQKHFEWLGKQSLDFFLPNYNIGIECQGKQHFGNGGWSSEYDFASQRERDVLKNKLCQENDVKVIYFTHQQVEYDGLYTIENTYTDVLHLGMLLGVKQQSWVEEIGEFLNSIQSSVSGNKELEIFCIDLCENSEKNVINNFEVNRMKSCRQEGKMSFHIFEDEWLFKQDIVKSRINNFFHNNSEIIYARKCEVRYVENKIAKLFLEKNHIQGNVYGKYNLGLFYKNELVSLMTFCELRKNLGSVKVQGVFEMLRFCNKLNTSVIGGASKLFKYFIKDKTPLRIISYCDLRWSDGGLYDKLGFRLEHVSRPNYFYINNDNKVRENRFKYRKDILVKNGFDANKSEHEIMLERGIYRIYDCGCKVYAYDIFTFR